MGCEYNKLLKKQFEKNYSIINQACEIKCLTDKKVEFEKDVLFLNALKKDIQNQINAKLEEIKHCDSLILQLKTELNHRLSNEKQ